MKVTDRRLMAVVLAAVAGALLFSNRTLGQAPSATSDVRGQDSARAQPLDAPTVVSAIDGILHAFQHHPLVGIGDDHNSAQEEDFYAALVRDPRFSTEVGNVVVEFGGAAHQDILDGYLNGQEISYADLRTIWTDVVGWIPTVTGLGYANFFAQVRVVNLIGGRSSVGRGSRSENPSQVQALSRIPCRHNFFIRSSHVENAA